MDERRSVRDRKRKEEFNIGDRVKIKTWHFGKQYSKGLPEYTEGKIVSIKGKKVGVRYCGDKKVYDTNRAHLDKCEEKRVSQMEDVVVTVVCKGKRHKRSQTFYTIMASLEVGSALKKSEESVETSWPKDFFEALVRND